MIPAWTNSPPPDVPTQQQLTLRKKKTCFDALSVMAFALVVTLNVDFIITNYLLTPVHCFVFFQ
jgi:hypothetical protein